MRRAVRAIVIQNNNLLVMHRNKFGKEYDTLPGGNIEVGESPEEALARELAEETGIVFKNPRLVFVEHAGDPYGDQYVFLCEYMSGEPELAADSEERAINKLGQNLYQPGWAQLDTLAKGEFLSTKLRDAILYSIKHGWSEAVVEIS